MSTTETQAATWEARAAVALGRLPGWSDSARTVALAAPPVASPTHRATASDCLRVERAGAATAFVKVRLPGLAKDAVPWAAEASRRAASLGVGPAVLAEGEGVLAFAMLDPPWRTATAGDLREAGVLRSSLGARRILHAGPPLGLRFDPFSRIAALEAEARAVCAPLPSDAASLLSAVALARAAIEVAGFDLRFCHNDGAASNHMLAAGEVRLVDFDSAGDNDPWYDVAVVLNESCEFDDERRAAIALYAGRCDERDLARCRLYGAIDDVLWGLWGIVRAVTAPRDGVEFFKYGQWRLLHARTAIGSRDFEACTRCL